MDQIKFGRYSNINLDFHLISIKAQYGGTDFARTVIYIWNYILIFAHVYLNSVHKWTQMSADELEFSINANKVSDWFQINIQAMFITLHQGPINHRCRPSSELSIEKHQDSFVNFSLFDHYLWPFVHQNLHDNAIWNWIRSSTSMAKSLRCCSFNLSFFVLDPHIWKLNATFAWVLWSGTLTRYSIAFLNSTLL